MMTKGSILHLYKALSLQIADFCPRFTGAEQEAVKPFWRA